jgi:hypothetical protein
MCHADWLVSRKPNLQTKQIYGFLSTHMARSNPNKTLKSPHKQQIEEQNKQDKIDTTTNITTHATKTS